MIVGTAGHIDHGKTTLVRALTGVDTDRLPEEKKRGISIELGYAYLDLPGVAERIGFIDVPGHERLVATMLAGATGIDHALLLVAADDGPMPQTREHLAALALLGIGRGAIVVTKADRVDAARVAEVTRDARALVAATPFQNAPIVAVSAATGQGVEALRAVLGAAAAEFAAQRPAADIGAGFRLAVDRVFSLAGIGTVVTGTAHAGRVVIGDSLQLVPGPLGAPVRVRSIHAQNVATHEAVAGERVALGLVGIERAAIERGQWLVAPSVAFTTDRLDARIDLWRGETRALRSGAVVRVHLGAASVLASVAVLDNDGDQGGDSDGKAIAPGGGGRVQLVLRAPFAAWQGDRLVLRDGAGTSGSGTFAGGVVLDPSAPARYRRTPERLAALDAAALADPVARLHARLAVALQGIDLRAQARSAGRLDTAEADTPPGTLLAHGGDAQWALAADQAAALETRVLQALDAWHGQHADEPGPDAARLRRRVAPRMAPPLFRAVLDAGVGRAVMAVRAGHYVLPRHDARLSAIEQRIVERAWPRLVAGGFDPPWLRTLVADLREAEPLVRAALQRSAQRGELHQVVRDLYYPAPTLARAAALVRSIATRDGDVAAAAFRDASGLGRKRAIQILEYLDRVGLLRRVGDGHRLRNDCELFAESDSGG